MNGRIIGYVGGLGLVMGIASVLGGIHAGHEGWFWLVIELGSALLIGRFAVRQFFVHGLIAGFIAGTACTLIQGLFLETYLAHNPRAATTFQQLPAGISPQIFVLVSAPVIGIGGGVALGLLSWLASALIKRGRPADTPI